ncbi:c-type cytochrome [Candidatus Marinarcus aquaticus]|uniref:Cytochrome c oxidase subunit III n=1 Tax=Candidatus Marinarcus aquaticus TaxID=2044504 RepID=A0A4Q0XTI2_9BACT|nr:c-type cytochrome [Candidatus Marinarcus aquaticus]RXJ57731.1 cytochrome C oxidase subunit III [Candidatus Marinarcus aquaticus]
MKSMVIGGIILIVALMAGTYFVAGDSLNFGEDYINDLTMLAGLAIISITVFVALKYVNQIKNDTASGDLAEENWDGIGEFKNPIPTGWGLAFIGVIVWGMWYMTVGYPTNGFSQIGQWNEETLEYNAKFESKWQNPDADTLTAMGESIFLVQCAPCHGVDAQGIGGKAQDLTQRLLKESVVYAIKNGASNFKTQYPAGMPPMMLTDEKEIDEVATYVAGGLKGEQPASFAVCAGCHGADGNGMEYVAPSLKTYTDSVITAVLDDGKKANIGTMPSFKGRLNETQYKALATYIRGLGE